MGVIWAGASAEGARGQATTVPPAEATPTAVRERPRDGEGNVVGPGRVGWWNDCVFYEIFVRSFQDSTTGPLANDGVGDLRGIIERLDYLNDGDPETTTDLGITGIWLMPIQPSHSYHGYDVTDYLSVNPEYGSEADLRELLVECRRRGIRVILDFVPNHSSSRHSWFVDAQRENSPWRDWYLWADERPAYRGPWGQQVWHPQRERRGDRRGAGSGASTPGPGGTASAPASAPGVDTRPPISVPTMSDDAPTGPFYYGLFGHNMPDLNYRNEAVSAEMLRVARYWLAPPPAGLGIDGLRLDAIRHLIENGPQQDNTPETHAWLARFYADYKAAAPAAMTIGEVWAPTPIAASYVGGELDLTFEFDLAEAMIRAVDKGDARRFTEAQDEVLRHYPPNQYGRFLSNHDQVRVATRLGGHPGKLRAAAALLLLGPGVPFLYYGEEVGQPGGKPDPELRTPMPWNADERRGFSNGQPWRARFPAPSGTDVASQTDDPASLLSWYRMLIALRQQSPAILHGGYRALASSSPRVAAFLRFMEAKGDGAAHTAIVVVNLSDEAVERPVISAAMSPMRGTWAAEDPPAVARAVCHRMIAAGGLSDGAFRCEIPTLEAFETRVYLLRQEAGGR
jgi:alpha-amylase